jgi:hypothetical protein
MIANEKPKQLLGFFYGWIYLATDFLGQVLIPNNA